MMVKKEMIVSQAWHRVHVRKLVHRQSVTSRSAVAVVHAAAEVAGDAMTEHLAMTADLVTIEAQGMIAEPAIIVDREVETDRTAIDLVMTVALDQSVVTVRHHSL